MHSLLVQMHQEQPLLSLWQLYGWMAAAQVSGRTYLNRGGTMLSVCSC